MKPNRPPSIFSEMTSCQALGKKKLAVLIDPDGINPDNLFSITEQLSLPGIGYVFIGGSFIQKDRLETCLRYLKENTDLPLILFPGHYFQVNALADAILFLSLISGRNPEFLIGQQVIAAPYIKESGLESIASLRYWIPSPIFPFLIAYFANRNLLDDVGFNNIAFF